VGRQPEPIILIDTREQRPLVLPNSRRATLATGDYSVEGYVERIAVERKSLEDVYGCFGASRDRFERELGRLALIEFRALVIEANMAHVLQGTKYSAVHPHSAIGSLISWSVRYKLPVWFCGDRRGAAGTVRKILYAAVKEIVDNAK
jgi:DNA excision repair protein ERCC-4